MNQLILQKQPFVRIVIFLALGIITQMFLPFGKPIIIYCLALVTLIYFVSFFLNENPANFSISGFSIALVFYFLGLYISVIKNETTNLEKGKQQIYLAKILETPKHKNKYSQVPILVMAERNGQNWAEKSYKLMASFESDSASKNLYAGQQILFAGEPKQIRAKRNPFDFDYKHYMQLKNIYHSIYLSKNQWQLLNTKASGLRQKALNLRQHIIDLYAKAGIEGEQLAVFSALTLGYKDMLESETKKAYSGAGAMHVLAVSGLHVGIVMLLLKYILGLAGFIKRIRVHYLIIILGIWAYAFVTGLSVSVLRSSLMFTFLLFGQLLNKRLHIYNSLAASALVLLLINPNFLFEVGFQLSYIAVAGIVFFQPKIEKLLYFKPWILKKLWALTAVSLAAQISTFPITAYYFHQFPTYFWLSNFIVILAATICIVGGFALALLSNFNFLSVKLGWLINELLLYLNNFIYWINNLPNSIVKGLSVDAYQVFMFYLVILLFSGWLISKKYKLLVSSLVIIILLLGFNAVKQVQTNENNAFCIYQVPNISALHIINGNTTQWLITGNEGLNEDFFDEADRFWNSKIRKRINNFCFDTSMCTKEFMVKQNFIGLLKYKGLVLNNGFNKYQLNSNDSIMLDFILVSGNSNIDYSDIPGNINYKNIVIDGTVSAWNAKRWLNAENVCIHYTKQDGAFMLTDNHGY